MALGGKRRLRPQQRTGIKQIRTDVVEDCRRRGRRRGVRGAQPPA